MTVGEMRQRMSAEEFTQWAAFYTLEPWGDARADLRNGVVASLLFNIHKSKDAAPLSPADFMLFQEREAPAAETPAEGDALKRRFQVLFPARPAKGKKRRRTPPKKKTQKR